MELYYTPIGKHWRGRIATETFALVWSLSLQVMITRPDRSGMCNESFGNWPGAVARL